MVLLPLFDVMYLQIKNFVSYSLSFTRRRFLAISEGTRGAVAVHCKGMPLSLSLFCACFSVCLCVRYGRLLSELAAVMVVMCVAAVTGYV